MEILGAALLVVLQQDSSFFYGGFATRPVVLVSHS